MKVIVKVLSLGFVLTCLAWVVYVLYFVKETDYSSKIPIEANCRSLDAPFDFESKLKGLDFAKIKESFPYDAYLESGNYCNAEAVKNSLTELNKINPDQENSNRDVLIYSLTNKLETKIEHRFESFNPDSLILILQWVDEFKAYEKNNPENGALYGIVYDHWMGFISKQLGRHYDDHPSIRFDFKFKYLRSICQSKRFAPAVGMSNTEKVVEYTLNQEYAYLFNRFWNGTNIFIKLIFVILLFIFIYMLYCTFQYRFKK